MDIHLRKKRAFEIGFVLYGMLVFLLSFVANTSIVTFFIGTLPVLASLVVLVYLIEHDSVSATVLTLVPIAASALFYAVWLSETFELLSRMDGPVIVVINVIASYVIYAFVLLFWGNRVPPSRHAPTPKVQSRVEYRDAGFKDVADTYSRQAAAYAAEKEQYRDLAAQYASELARFKHELEAQRSKQQDYSVHIRKYIASLVDQIKRISINDRLQDSTVQHKHMEKQISRLKGRLHEAEQSLRITKENFTTNLRSIEDKCKALNFVIGRVYADKNGGSEDIRSLLRIERELYNIFSELTATQDTAYYPHLRRVLELLRKKLLLLHLPERKLFSLGKGNQLTRDVHGNTAVLDVLAANDKDPVKEYHAEASEICGNMLRFLRV